MKTRMFLFVALVSILGLTGCGGNGGNDTPPIYVTISPATPTTLVINQTQKFTANVTVTWSVNNVPGGNATVGTISSDGTYTAPNMVPSPANVTVTATSTADISKSAWVAVDVTMIFWNQSYGITSAYNNVVGLAVASDGTITAGGGNLQKNYQSWDAVGISYSTDGNRRWAMEYTNLSGFGFGSAINRGTETDFGGGSSNPLNPAETNPIVATVDANGNVTNIIVCSGQGAVESAYQETSTSGAFAGILGNSVVIWQDVGGAVDCANTATIHDLDNQGARALSIVSAPDHYLVAGDFAGGILTNKSSYVIKTDKSGNKIWRANFPDVDAAVSTERMEGSTLSVYLFGQDFSQVVPKFFTVRLDQNGNTWPGWPVEWDGDNPASSAQNFPSAVVPSPAANGGIVCVGFSTKLNAQDVNDTDTILVSYKPDGTVYWKLRVHLSSSATGGEQIHGAVLDPNNNLVLAGWGGGFSNETSLVAKIALPR